MRAATRPNAERTPDAKTWAPTFLNIDSASARNGLRTFCRADPLSPRTRTNGPHWSPPSAFCRQRPRWAASARRSILVRPHDGLTDRRARAARGPRPALLDLLEGAIGREHSRRVRRHPHVCVRAVPGVLLSADRRRA